MFIATEQKLSSEKRYLFPLKHKEYVRRVEITSGSFYAA